MPHLFYKVFLIWEHHTAALHLIQPVVILEGYLDHLTLNADRHFSGCLICSMLLCFSLLKFYPVFMTGGVGWGGVALLWRPLTLWLVLLFTIS